jgi:hypothetical protein
MLDKEEYVEQAYLFRTIGERLPKNMPLQELMRQAKEELLATAKLPMAVDFLRTELEHSGNLWTAMEKLSHYFSPFQTYVVREAENERGQFDLRVAVEVLRAEAEYRCKEITKQGLFLFQFETLCRNRLRYDAGLAAIAADTTYDADWRSWIRHVRHQVGLIDFCDLLYVRSEYYLQRRRQLLRGEVEPEEPILFGPKEGKIAFANRGKDPLYLFAALQRHLGYPAVPRPQPVDRSEALLPLLMRRLERVESRLKLLEDEQHTGIDLREFYGPDAGPPRLPADS